MKKFILLLSLLLAGFVSCSKQDLVEPEAPHPQTEELRHFGQCEDCGFRGCTNRNHDICTVCGVSRRPPGGCLCAGADIGGFGLPDPNNPNPNNPPTGTLRVTPTQITITGTTPATVNVELWDGGAWRDDAGMIWGISYEVIPQGLYDVSWSQHNNSFNVSKIPGTSGGTAYLYVYQQEFINNTTVKLIGTVTIN